MLRCKPEEKQIVINNKAFKAVQYLYARDIDNLSSDEKGALSADHIYLDYSGIMDDHSWSRMQAYIYVGEQVYEVEDTMWIVFDGQHKFFVSDATFQFLVS